MTPEFSDQQMVIHLVERMDRRTSLATIIARLASVQSAIEMAGMLVNDDILSEHQAVDWIENVVKQYESRETRRLSTQ